MRLGELTIHEEIGQGGFGVVHRATLGQIHVHFAVKFLTPSPFHRADQETHTKRFLQEAHILFRLRHRFITPIYTVGEHDGRPFILMEYFDGRSIDKIAPPVDPQKILPFLVRVGEGLAHAHGNNVVHRDIKPSNLMTRTGDTRILDFGVAGLLDPTGERFTKVGETIVGDAFSAPELHEDPRLVSPVCDLYSLGACWFWVLTRKTPKGHNWQSELRKSVEVKSEYERVLFRCLDQQNARYQSASELLVDLRALIEGRQPTGVLDIVNDTAATVLGAVREHCECSNDSTTLYRLEQRLGQRIVRLSLMVLLERLARTGHIKTTEETDIDGSMYNKYAVTDLGRDWVEKNLAKVESLLAAIPESSSKIADDDFPF